MLFEPANAALEIANEDAVADDRRVILDDGAAQPDDLLAGLLVLRRLPCFRGDEVRGTLARRERTSDFTSARSVLTSARSDFVAISARISRRS